MPPDVDASYLGGDPTSLMYLGEGDCDDSTDCFSSLECLDISFWSDSIPGVTRDPTTTVYTEESDFCYCPNHPICPWGHSGPGDFSYPEALCPDGKFVDSIEFDTDSFALFRYRCSNLDGTDRTDFFTQGIGSGNFPDSYRAEGAHFCGMKGTYGATDSYKGLLSLDLMLCESFNCKDSLTTTSNYPNPLPNPLQNPLDRVYNIDPVNTDFEKPAI